MGCFAICFGFLYSSSAGRNHKPTATTGIVHGYTTKRTGDLILLQILKTNSSSDKREYMAEEN